MDNFVKRKRYIYLRKLIRYKTMSNARLFILFFIFVINNSTPVHSQNFNNGIGQLSLGELSLKLTGLDIDFSLESNLVNEGSLSIDEMVFGFNDVGMNITAKNNSHVTHINFSGPNYTLNKFNFLLNAKTPDIISNILAELKEKRISTPTLGLKLIGRAMELYYENNPSPAESVQVLFDQGYLISSSHPFNQWEWTFSIISPTKIRATSSNKFIMGQGLVIELDLLSWEMSGYGISNPNQKEWNNWVFSINIEKIILDFISQLNVEISDASKDISFSLKRGKFNLHNYAIIATPDKNLEQQFSFHIGNYGISLRDVHLRMNNRKDTPSLEEFIGSIILRNLEIKIPEEIHEQPEIKNLTETIGIYNGLFKIRQLQINTELLDDGSGKVHLIIRTPFAQMNIIIHIHINELGGQEHHYEFHNSEIVISHLSPGLSKAIHQWETETRQSLHREGDKIVLKIYGDLKQPRLKGIDLKTIHRTP